MSPVRLLAALGVLVAVAAAPAVGGDRAKRDCRDGCQEALRSCRAECAPTRDSGDLEASGAYVDCDGTCHETYAGCIDACSDD